MADGRVLYLVRHGVAAERGPEYPDDALRPLTADGRARLREIGAGLVALGLEWDEILTSPFVRARETAEILAAAWPKPPPVTELAALAVGGRSSNVLAALAAHPAGQHVALVGHMPGIGTLAGELLGTSHGVEFKKGAVACVTVERTPGRAAGQLQWFAPPKMLRQLGRRKA